MRDSRSVVELRVQVGELVVHRGEGEAGRRNAAIRRRPWRAPAQRAVPGLQFPGRAGPVWASPDRPGCSPAAGGPEDAAPRPDWAGPGLSGLVQATP